MKMTKDKNKTKNTKILKNSHSKSVLLFTILFTYLFYYLLYFLGAEFREWGRI